MLAPKAGAARGSGPAEDGGFDTARVWQPGSWQVGTKEQALRSNQGTTMPARRGIAVTSIQRLQSFTQWWVRLIKPHTQKFGHSRVEARVVISTTWHNNFPSSVHIIGIKPWFPALVG